MRPGQIITQMIPIKPTTNAELHQIERLSIEDNILKRWAHLWQMTFASRIEIKPKAQPRPRPSRHGGIIEDVPTRDYKIAVAQALAENLLSMNMKRVPGHIVRVDFEFGFAYPKSEKDPIDRKPTTKGPDIDNMAKAILDAIQKGAWVKKSKSGGYTARPGLSQVSDPEVKQMLKDGLLTTKDSEVSVGLICKARSESPYVLINFYSCKEDQVKLLQR